MQLTKRYLFAEWQHWQRVIVLGELAGPKFKRETLCTFSIEELKSADVSKWLGVSGENEALLFFHAMWGQQPAFQRKSLSSIEKILNTQSDRGIHTIISFRWYAGGMMYRRNWQLALEKGEPLGLFVRWICEHYGNKVNVLCHSMGNRLFEGALRTAIEHNGKGTILRKLILFSPDLDTAVDDTDFIRLCESAEDVLIFMHRHDRLLMLSSWSHGRERLGRSGTVGDIGSFCASCHLQVVDMTNHVKGIHNHTHLNRDWVQQRIREALTTQGSVP